MIALMRLASLRDSSREQRPPELDIGKPFAHGIEVAGGVCHRTATQQVRWFQPGDLRHKLSQGPELGILELSGPLGSGQPVLKPDPEQDRVLDDETAEYRNAGFGEVPGRVLRLGKGSEVGTQHLEGTRAGRDKQPVFGAGRAVVFGTGWAGQSLRRRSPVEVITMWWQDIIIVGVIALGIYGFVVLIRYMTQQMTRKTDRRAEDMYDEFDSARKEKDRWPI
jgi:hypothetical protein